VQSNFWARGRDRVYEMIQAQPDPQADLGYGLLGWRSIGYAPDELTAAMV